MPVGEDLRAAAEQFRQRQAAGHLPMTRMDGHGLPGAGEARPLRAPPQASQQRRVQRVAPGLTWRR